MGLCLHFTLSIILMLLFSCCCPCIFILFFVFFLYCLFCTLMIMFSSNYLAISCCSTSFFYLIFLLRSILLNPHFAFNCPFILIHILLFCYPPIVQLEFFFSSRHHACPLALWLLLCYPFISLILLLCYLYFAPSHFCTSVKCELFLPLSSNLVKFSCFNSLFILLCCFVA
jgi:hypothetical protein